MKKITTLLVCLAIYSSHSLASFKSSNWNDDMNDVKIYEQTTFKGKNAIGFRCDISKGKDKDFMMTFASDDSIATPNNGKLELKMRVDSGEVYSLKGRTYSNSYKSGLIRNIPDELLKEIKAGNKLLVNIYVYSQLKFNQSFSLNGSTKALKDTAGKCDYLVSSNPKLEKEINKLEAQRDKEIRNITAKYSREIKALKAKY